MNALRTYLADDRWVLAWGGTLSVVTFCLLPFRDRIEPGTAALLMLFGPLVAAFGTLRLALIASVVSALTFNFVFTEPYYSFVIDSTTSVVAFLTYGAFSLVLALVIGRMRDAVADSARHARDSRHRISLVQSVSHDLRTPLASVRALASAIPQAGRVTAEQQDIIDDIERYSIRLGRMVEDVLDLTRIEGGLLKPRLQTVALDDVLASAIDAIDDDSVSLRVDNDVPPVPVDEVLIRQVLINLLDNAQRFGAPPVQVRVVAAGDHVEIRVRDRGVGISEEQLRSLFDPEAPLRQQPSGRARGLGLLVSEGFVRAHGGVLRAERPRDGGSMFVVELPLAADRDTIGADA